MSDTVLSTLTNHQFRLASRPVGLPTRDNWSATTEAVAEPEDGGVVLRQQSGDQRAEFGKV